MAFKLETGSEAYAPLARVIIAGLLSSIVLTIFVVPAAYLLMYQRRERAAKPRLQNRRRHDATSYCAVGHGAGRDVDARRNRFMSSRLKRRHPRKAKRNKFRPRPPLG